VVVWDLDKNARRFDLRGHTDAILTADLAADGKTLATGSYDRMVKLWDIAKGEEVRTLKEHTDAIYAVAFSPDGKTLASAAGDRTVKLWDAATGSRHQSLSDATVEVYAVAFSPDGKMILAAGADRSIRSWKLGDKAVTLAQTVIGHNAAILRLVVSPDGKTLYSSGEDRDVKLWNLPGLEPRSTLADQPDWPLAVAVSSDGSRLAIGRYDGSLAVFETSGGKLAMSLREAAGKALAQAADGSKPQPPPKPQLVRNASLNPPSPRGAARGSTLKLTLTGTGVGQATGIIFSEPGISSTIVPAAKPDANWLEVELAIAGDAAVGLHRFGVQTPLGMTQFQSFAVSAYADQAEAEPNDEPAKVKPVTLPATLVGTIDRPGDVDLFRFEAKAGQALVFETTAQALGSTLNGTLSLLDDAGRVVAEAQDSDGGSLDPLLTVTISRDGVYTLRMLDADYGGSGNHFYRIQAGLIPYVATTFPLGVERGQTANIEVKGLNLAGVTNVPVSAASSAEPGTIMSVPVILPDGSRPERSRKVVVADGRQAVEAEPNDEPGKATQVATPGGVSGRIDRSGDSDLYRFEAKKGQRLIVEVFGSRLGTTIDPVVEVLDAQGKSVPRAVLRPVAETFVAFRDHPSTGRGIRLTVWDDLAIGDYVLMGRELTRMFSMPRNPDDDAIFWGSGGERVGMLETTPEHHPMGQPIYKMEIHPPGATFPPGGIPPVTLVYRNDDGGPAFGRDARVTFDPPADGTYLVRVEDGRGFGGETYGYHLVVRRPKPDFRVTLNNDNPNVPRGGTMIVTATVTRLDGFEGPVEIKLEGLTEGITATSATIERQQYSADLALMADASAPATSQLTWKAVARALTDSSSDAELVHTIDPGGSRSGFITVTPAPDLKLAAAPERVTIQPGERVEMKFGVERNPNFSGRVPIDVRNLPHGVRVLNIGLNGVLVTEKQTERSVFLYAEPWVQPMERPFYASARLEILGKPMGGNGAPVIDSSREHVSPPIWLVVSPAKAGPQASTTTAPQDAPAASAR
jgi:hypothetical protein